MASADTPRLDAARVNVFVGLRARRRQRVVAFDTRRIERRECLPSGESLAGADHAG